MEFTFANTLVLLLLFSSVLLVILACGVYLAIRAKKYKSRLSLVAAVVFFLQASGLFSILLTAIFGNSIKSPFEELLAPQALIRGFTILIILEIYLIEIKNPNWINKKRLIMMVLPALILSITLLAMEGHIIRIHLLSELLTNVGRPDVIVRLLMVLLYLISGVMLGIMKPDSRLCQIPKQTMIRLSLIICIIPFLFVLGLIFGIYLAAVLQFVFILSLNSYIIYIEMIVRIPSVAQEPVSVENVVGETVFDNPEIWMNPDMSAVELAHFLGTNQKYLAEQIKSHGFASYTDMINRKRVKYICESLKNPAKRELGITQLMFDSGFRSRSTATSEFKRIVGCTPTEYLKTVS